MKSDIGFAANIKKQFEKSFKVTDKLTLTGMMSVEKNSKMTNYTMMKILT